MYKNADVYYPLDHFMPPAAAAKPCLRECMLSKLQWELEQHTSKAKAARLYMILEENGFTYFQKLLDTDLSVIQKIKGIGQKSLDIIRAVRRDYGVEEK